MPCYDIKGYFHPPEEIFVVVCRCLVAKSCPTSFVISCNMVHQVLLFMGFPRQEYWSGLPFPSPGDLSDTGLNSHLLLGRQILYH